MTAADLQEHADNLQEMLRRKREALQGNGLNLAERLGLMLQTEALEDRVAELDQQIRDASPSTGSVE